MKGRIIAVLELIDRLPLGEMWADEVYQIAEAELLALQHSPDVAVDSRAQAFASILALLVWAGQRANMYDETDAGRLLAIAVQLLRNTRDGWPDPPAAPESPPKRAN